jgi:Flp pilus assembly protein TadD
MPRSPGACAYTSRATSRRPRPSTTRAWPANPAHADSLHLLSTALAQTGELEEGIKALQATLEISPNEPTFRLNYAEAQSSLGCQALADGALVEAHISFSEAVGSNPDHKDAQMNLGVVSYQLGDPAAAESALTAVLAQAPQDPKALHNLGMVRRKKGDVPGSLAALWQVIKSDPHNPAHWSAFADVFQWIRFADDSDIDKPLGALLTLLARDDVDHWALAAQDVRLFRRDPALAQLIEAAETGNEVALDYALLDNGGIEAVMRPVVTLALERTILADLAIERIFTRIRAVALETLVSGRGSIPDEFIRSLAKQYFMNGYVWSYDEEEVSGVERMVDSLSGADLAADSDNVTRFAVLGCYVPLIEWERAEEVSTLAADLGSGEFSELVLQQIIEPCQELQLTELIPTYGGGS